MADNILNMVRVHLKTQEKKKKRGKKWRSAEDFVVELKREKGR